MHGLDVFLQNVKVWYLKKRDGMMDFFAYHQQLNCISLTQNPNSRKLMNSKIHEKIRYIDIFLFIALSSKM
jgi:hypothetical protein